MSRNGSGVYSPPGASFPAVAGTLIEAAKFNDIIRDIATALTQSMASDGQTVPTANIPMGGFRVTGAADAVSAGDLVTLRQLTGVPTTPADSVLKYTPSGYTDNPAEERTVLEELDWHVVSSLRFMTEVQRNDVLGRVGSTNVHAPMQKAIDYIASKNGGTLDLVPGIYSHTDAALSISSDSIYVKGRGHNSVIRRTGNFGNTIEFTGDDVTGTEIASCGLSDLVLTATNLMDNGAHVWLNACTQFFGKNVRAINGFRSFRFSGVRQSLVHWWLAAHSSLLGGTTTDRVGMLFDAAAATYDHPSCANLYLVGPQSSGSLSAPMFEHAYKITCADGIWFVGPYGSKSEISNFCLDASNADEWIGLIFLSNAMMDAGYGHGFHCKGTANEIFNVRSDGLYLHGGSDALNDETGFYVETGVDINHCEFNNTTIYATTKEGVKLMAGRELVFSDLTVRGASNVTADAYSGIYLENTEGVKFKGGRSGYDFPYTGARTARYGIEFGANNAGVELDIDLTGNVRGSIGGGAGQYRWSGGLLDRTPAAAVMENLVAQGGYHFNGTTDYLDGSALTGIADSKSFTFVCKLRFATAAAATEKFFTSSNEALRIERTATGGINVLAKNAALTTILNQSLALSPPSAAGTYTIMISADLAVPGSMRIYVNGVTPASLNAITFTDDTIDFTRTEYSIGADTAGASFFSGDMYVLWFDVGVYFDFDNADSRNKFFDRAGNAVNLGATGELPTGTAPVLFLGGYDYPEWPINRGTGTGAFVAHGTPAAPTTADYGFPDTVASRYTVTAATHTVGDTIDDVICNFAGVVTLTLPDAADWPGRVIRVRTVTANAVSSAASNVVLITGGAAGTTIMGGAAGNWVKLEAQGANWQITESN